MYSYSIVMSCSCNRMRYGPHLYEQLVQSLQCGYANDLAAVSREKQHTVIERFPEHVTANSSCKSYERVKEKEMRRNEGFEGIHAE